MKFLLIALLASLAVTLALADVTEDDLWDMYKGAHKKKHHPLHEAKRKAHFLATHKKIKEHNSRNHTYQMAHNEFSDLTDEEKQAKLGAKMDPTKVVRSFGEPAPLVISERALPSSIDYRTHKCMQPVKNQGSCGSCWSFASITPIEFNKCNITGTAVALSEQMLVDCDTSNGGCNGGWYEDAWNYVNLTAKGVMTAASYPYVSGTTKVAGTTCKLSATSFAAKVYGYRLVSLTTVPASELAIQTALNAYGPLPAAIKVMNSLYNYASGVYADSGCSTLAKNDVDHAVVIVGYGATTGTTPVPYWVVRNSWGTGWGVSGYVLFKRGVNMCNIESFPAYVNVA